MSILRFGVASAYGTTKMVPFQNAALINGSLPSLLRTGSLSSTIRRAATIGSAVVKSA